MSASSSRGKSKEEFSRLDMFDFAFQQVLNGVFEAASSDPHPAVKEVVDGVFTDPGNQKRVPHVLITLSGEQHILLTAPATTKEELQASIECCKSHNIKLGQKIYLVPYEIEKGHWTFLMGGLPGQNKSKWVLYDPLHTSSDQFRSLEAELHYGPQQFLVPLFSNNYDQLFDSRNQTETSGYCVGSIIQAVITDRLRNDQRIPKPPDYIHLTDATIPEGDINKLREKKLAGVKTVELIPEFQATHKIIGLMVDQEKIQEPQKLREQKEQEQRKQAAQQEQARRNEIKDVKPENLVAARAANIDKVGQNLKYDTAAAVFDFTFFKILEGVHAAGKEIGEVTAIKNQGARFECGDQTIHLLTPSAYEYSSSEPMPNTRTLDDSINDIKRWSDPNNNDPNKKHTCLLPWFIQESPKTPGRWVLLCGVTNDKQSTDFFVIDPSEGRKHSYQHSYQPDPYMALNNNYGMLKDRNSELYQNLSPETKQFGSAGYIGSWAQSIVTNVLENKPVTAKTLVLEKPKNLMDARQLDKMQKSLNRHEAYQTIAKKREEVSSSKEREVKDESGAALALSVGHAKNPNTPVLLSWMATKSGVDKIAKNKVKNDTPTTVTPKRNSKSGS